MFFLRSALLAIFVIFFTGCASLGQMQAAVTEIDDFWGQTNRKILAEKGSKILPVPVDRAVSAVRAAAASLGFTEQPSNLVNVLRFKAKSPTPFSEEEYKKIRIVEEPIMQAMASTHVGSMTSSFFVLTSSDTNTSLEVRLSPQGSENTLASLAFSLEWIKGNKQSGLLLGTQPPPEAVRRGIDKFWGSVSRSI